MAKPLKLASSNRDELLARKGQQPSKHDPADFLISAKDAKGESTRVFCRVMPAHDRAIDAIFYSRKFPFKTPSDIMRWCIHTGLKRLEALDEVPSVTQQVEAMMVILRDEEFHLEFQGFLQNAHAVVQRHIAEGSHGEARRVVAKLKQEIAKMPSGHWRTKYERVMARQFDHLLSVKKGAGVKLGTKAFDEDEEEEDEDH